MFSCTIPLSPVLEPVADLRSSESRAFCQFSLFTRRRIRISSVPIPQNASGFLLEAVRCLLAVPNSTGQRKFTPNAIFSCNLNIFFLIYKHEILIFSTLSDFNFYQKRIFHLILYFILKSYYILIT